MKKIIFMGTPQFAAYILEQLLATKQDLYEVVAVVSQPDKPVGRKRILTPTPVKEIALKHQLPVLQPQKIRDAYEVLAAYQPDLIITAAYGQIVPENILTLPTYKCINVHGSLLPKYRGGAPIHYAIMNGDCKTGITIMYMAKKMDAGDMLYQQEIPILAEDTLETMFQKLQVLGATMLQEMLPEFFAGTIVATPQDETQVTYSPTIKKAECQIDWQKSAVEIFNHVRGLSPIPATFTILGDTQIKLYQVTVCDQVATAPAGTIIAVDSKKCYVATGDGVIALLDLQVSGKKRQKITEIMNGVGRTLLVEGARFE